MMRQYRGRAPGLPGLLARAGHARYLDQGISIDIETRSCCDTFMTFSESFLGPSHLFLPRTPWRLNQVGVIILLFQKSRFHELPGVT